MPKIMFKAILLLSLTPFLKHRTALVFILIFYVALCVGIRRERMIGLLALYPADFNLYHSTWLDTVIHRKLGLDSASPSNI